MFSGTPSTRTGADKEGRKKRKMNSNTRERNLKNSEGGELRESRAQMGQRHLCCWSTQHRMQVRQMEKCKNKQKKKWQMCACPDGLWSSIGKRNTWIETHQTANKPQVRQPELCSSLKGSRFGSRCPIWGAKVTFCTKQSYSAARFLRLSTYP